MFHQTVPFEGNALEPHTQQLEQNLFPIERDIITKLHALGVTGYTDKWSTTRWTAEIKQGLLSLGDEQGFLTFPRHDAGSSGGEWMFDVVWVDAKPTPEGHASEGRAPEGYDWRYTRGLKLACECEWGTTEVHILEDFFKLTFVLADIRLFIYTSTKVTMEDHRKIHPVELCKRACPLSRGFRYLAVGFPPTGTTNELRLDVWVA